MKRSLKVALVVAVCLLPITGFYVVLSQPSLLYSQPFQVISLYGDPEHETHEVVIGWPFTQMQVVIEVTLAYGFEWPMLLNHVDIYDSANLHILQIGISGPGNYTSGWIYAQGVYNITITGAGYPYGGIEGQLTVYARGPIYVIIQGG